MKDFFKNTLNIYAAVGIVLIMVLSVGVIIYSYNRGNQEEIQSAVEDNVSSQDNSKRDELAGEAGGGKTSFNKIEGDGSASDEDEKSESVASSESKDSKKSESSKETSESDSRTSESDSRTSESEKSEKTSSSNGSERDSNKSESDRRTSISTSKRSESAATAPAEKTTTKGRNESTTPRPTTQRTTTTTTQSKNTPIPTTTQRVQSQTTTTTTAKRVQPTTTQKQDVVEYKTITENYSIPYGTTDNYASTGAESRVYQQGKNGTGQKIYEVKYVNGVEVSRNLKTDKVIGQPTQHIIERYVNNPTTVTKEVEDPNQPIWELVKQPRDRWFTSNSKGEVKYYYSAEEALAAYSAPGTDINQWGTADPEPGEWGIVGYKTKTVTETVDNYSWVR